MEAMGLRTAIRAGTEMQALAMTTEASRQTFAGFRAGDVRERWMRGTGLRRLPDFGPGTMTSVWPSDDLPSALRSST
jgi:hypothetical protein